MALHSFTLESFVLWYSKMGCYWVLDNNNTA